MSADFSREAFAARLGDTCLALAEAAADSAPPPSPETVERLRRIVAPVLARLAERERVADIADAA